MGLKVDKIKGYKGFTSKLSCRNMQYEVGKEYSCEGEIVACKNGLHMCSRPVSVFRHYHPFGSDDKRDFSRYCEVEGGGTVVSDNDMEKSACSKMKIVKEIPFVDYVEKCLENLKLNSGKRGNFKNEVSFEAVCATGDLAKNDAVAGGAIASNRQSVVVNKNAYGIACARGRNSHVSNFDFASVAYAVESQSVAVNSGNNAVALTTGIKSAAISNAGQSGSLCKGMHSLAACMYQDSKAQVDDDFSSAVTTAAWCKAEAKGKDSSILSAGDLSKAVISGEDSAILSLGCGSKAVSCGKRNVVICLGYDAAASGKVGDFLVFGVRDGISEPVKDIKVLYVDGKRVLPDTLYKV